MGLDITALRRIQRTDVALDEYDDAWDKYRGSHRSVFANTEWPERAPEITKNGVYTYEEEFGFRAGSYGGYNQWRDQLAQLVGYAGAAAVWAEPQPGPFVELINFSDCEGVIGATVSAKLAKDFADWQEKADAHEDEWFRAKYAEWRKSFEMAADGGCVEFH